MKLLELIEVGDEIGMIFRRSDAPSCRSAWATISTCHRRIMVSHGTPINLMPKSSLRKLRTTSVYHKTVHHDEHASHQGSGNPSVSRLVMNRLYGSST